MAKHPINTQYTAYAWLIDKNGNPVTGAAGNISCTVFNPSETVFANPTVAEVDSSNAPGLYKASFTPNALGFWKIYWNSTQANADISGGEVLVVCDCCADEQNDYAYPDGDTTEKNITELLTTPWTGYYGRRRTHKGTFFDLSNIFGDASTPTVTIRRYVKVDGTNWKRIDTTVLLPTADPCVTIDPLTLKKPYKITMQLSAGLAVPQDLPYHYVICFDDLCC